jgi:lycopene beta-cyclase
MSPFDHAIVGGGLQGGLLAMAILHARPDARIVLIERDGRLGGNHTWCHGHADVPPDARAWVDPLVATRWTGTEVRFPDATRRLGGGYAAITSARLDAVVRERLAAAPGGELITGQSVESLEAHEVRLADGRRIEAALVVDARGPREPPADWRTGYQKFVGLEVALDRPWPLAHPLLMDATVPQLDGFRFVYVLPYAPDRLLVEDTYFADGPDLDRTAVAARCLEYLADRGYRSVRVEREEWGVLPMPWVGGLPEPQTAGPLRAGFGGGWFHPGTGYSTPCAVRLARLVAGRAPADVIGPDLEALRREHVWRARFAQALNFALFGVIDPPERWRFLARFYRDPEGLVDRWFALEMTRADCARILWGYPPRGLSLRKLARRLLGQP